MTLKKWIVLFFAMLAFMGFAGTNAVTLAGDGFPTGQNSPEGVACDFARAFMHSDVDLLKSSCLEQFGTGEVRSQYATFRQTIIEGTERDKMQGELSPKSPKAIGKVFAARPLSLNGPASWGYTVYNYQEVMFVDIGALLQDGSRFLNRTLVVKKSDGLWYVHPCPSLDQLLSAGLNDEPPSEIDFADRSRDALGETSKDEEMNALGQRGL